MTTAPTAMTVGEVLEGLANWRTDEETRQKAELVEVDQETQNLRAAIQNLQQQLEALLKFRSELESKAELVGSQEVGRAYDGIFASLREQAQVMADRSNLVAEAEGARNAALVAELESGDMAETFTKYREFRTTVEPTLDALPDYARTMLVEHHNKVAETVRAHVSESIGSPMAVDADEITVEVVVGVDAPDGVPELAIVVVPVSETVHGAWLDREEDLQTRLALRVVQGVYQAVAKSGPVGAQAMAGGHQGLLAIELEIVGAAAGAADTYVTCISEAIASATELTAAHVKVQVRNVPVDYLLPAEEHEEDANDAG